MTLFKDIRTQVRFSDEKMQKVNLFETERFFCDIYCLEPGQEQKLHAHENEDKVYFVLEGCGTIQIGKDSKRVAKNQICHAPRTVEHGVKNTSSANLTLLVFMTPNPNY